MAANPTLAALGVTGPEKFLLIAGPCVVEGADITFAIAEKLKALCAAFGVPFVFKASYRKANRSSVDSFTGIGDEKALEILASVKKELGLTVLTDIHSESEAALAAVYVDVLQIPAFLCRQTSLLEAAAATGKMVNIKKGQFAGPVTMKLAAEKVNAAGNPNVLITERGNFFGYEDLVVDMRNIPAIRGYGLPVVLDCTHSLQRPNQAAGVTGGMPQYITTMARAGIAAGADGLFIETHPRPAEALSDGANMLPLDRMEMLLESVCAVRTALAAFDQ